MPTIFENTLLQGLQLGLPGLTTVENDVATPAGQAPTVVDEGLSVGLLSDLAVQDGAHVTVTGIQASLLSTADIGSGGTLTLNTPIGASLFGQIQFVGPNASLELGSSTANNLLGNLGGSITGFANSDSIQLDGVSGATHVAVSQNLLQFLQGGSTVTLLNAQNQGLGSISLSDRVYGADNFSVSTVNGNDTLVTVHT